MKTFIEIEDESFTCPCGGYPTIYEFNDIENNYYLFRYRHGLWFLEKNKKYLVSHEFESNDGICSWEQAKEFMASKDIVLIDEKAINTYKERIREIFREIDEDIE